MTTWILLRGLTREVRHWGDFPQKFAGAMQEATVLAIDLPGNGEFHAETSPTRIEDMTDRCRAELMRRGVPPPYRLLAISMGGMIAVDWATRYATEVDAAALINTSMRPFSGFHQRLRISAWPRLLRAVALTGSAEAIERAIFALTSNQSQVQVGLIEDWVHIRRTHPVSGANMWRQLLAAARFCAPAAPPPARLLVLGSAGDRLVNVLCSMALAQAWACEAALHPTAGHDLPLDEGEWVIAKVRNWLTAGQVG